MKSLKGQGHTTFKTKYHREAKMTVGNFYLAIHGILNVCI